MKVGELIKRLQEYPEDMQVWVSDNGYYEGGERLVKVEKVLAYDAGLDSDSVKDEWLYVEEDTNISSYLAKGYILSEDGEVLSKAIIYLNDEV
jgi:hypothetical protein